MADQLDIHPASTAEQAAAHANSFDVWHKGLALDEHVQTRLASPKHQLATWYVGTLDGRVVVALACYPLSFRWQGERVPGIAIGAVHTLGEFRGRGFAPQLLSFVEDEQRARGAILSLLYSDIKPDYYARLGYTLCPSLEGWTDPRSFSPPEPPAHRLEPIDARSNLPQLATLYADYHGAMPLAIDRDAAYWKSLLERAPDERFFRLADAEGGWHGYVRLARNNSTLRTTDYALADQSLDLATELYAASLLLAKDQGAERFGGWLPDHPSARQFFALNQRPDEITMLKSFSPQQPLDNAAIELTSRFCEIDHV